MKRIFEAYCPQCNNIIRREDSWGQGDSWCPNCNRFILEDEVNWRHVGFGNGRKDKIMQILKLNWDEGNVRSSMQLDIKTLQLKIDEIIDVLNDMRGKLK